MPDFRGLFTFARVITCSCFCSRKPAKIRTYQFDNVRTPSGQKQEKDLSAEDHYYGISQSPHGVLPDPDKFEIVDEHDESTAAGTVVKRD
ncbi:hypothetical protein FVEN_g5404 [Fusarium venenatum]|uniref:Uncharacterized protein n=1 Tax=Fusarium venenatum TaxID=56646 RepID=A0A2L2TSS0_9HYPO|nr:uncharacterized protein FVRRES_08514 [Fusarium venenatum]KAG8356814.1 hypothetical protein FVEN_g5404 [Fusarium venenatum]CEI68437.1 unnamed protein product [Fusarium venenatum]